MLLFSLRSWSSTCANFATKDLSRIPFNDTPTPDGTTISASCLQCPSILRSPLAQMKGQTPIICALARNYLEYLTIANLFLFIFTVYSPGIIKPLPYMKMHSNKWSPHHNRDLSCKLSVTYKTWLVETDTGRDLNFACTHMSTALCKPFLPIGNNQKHRRASNSKIANSQHAKAGSFFGGMGGVV